MDLSDRSSHQTKPLGKPARLSPLVTLRKQLEELRPRLRRIKFNEVFWKGSALFSLAVNLLLIILLIVLARNLFSLKDAFVEPLVGNLHTGFRELDQAHIRTTITVSEELPVSFDLPVQDNTVVTLSESTVVEGANVSIRTGALTIANAPATVTLPLGTRLPITLDFSVPVETSVPVELSVPVDIPLEETELHEPFMRLQNLMADYRARVDRLPDCWSMVLWGGACR